jgi:hypothetical protein
VFQAEKMEGMWWLKNKMLSKLRRQDNDNFDKIPNKWINYMVSLKYIVRFYWFHSCLLLVAKSRSVF